MKYFKHKPPKKSDVYLTPRCFANRIIDHFNPSGRVLEPCAGPGLKGGYIQNDIFTDWCEITEGKDFLEWNEQVDWIITNPPYSILGLIIEHALTVSQNIVIAPVMAHQQFGDGKLQKMLRAEGWGFKECVWHDRPPAPFPKLGWQFCALHLEKGHESPMIWTDWRVK